MGRVRRRPDETAGVTDLRCDVCRGHRPPAAELWSRLTICPAINGLLGESAAVLGPKQQPVASASGLADGDLFFWLSFPPLTLSYRTGPD